MVFKNTKRNVKKSTLLYLDVELVKWAKSNKLNMSFIFNEMLRGLRGGNIKMTKDDETKLLKEFKEDYNWESYIHLLGYKE